MRKIVSLIALIILVASCAKEAPNQLEGLDISAFKSWIKKNAPNAKEISNSVYIEYFRKGNIPNDTLKIIPYVSWLKLIYTGRKFDDRVFVTRDSSLSRRIGKWSAGTHFNDDYATFDQAASKFCIGLQIGLLDMKRGDSARIYIPKHLSYASTMSVNAGYLGESVPYTGDPLYFNIRLDDIINNPVKYEETQIEDWAVKKFGLQVKDTLTKGAYMKITKSVPEGHKITKDSTIKVTMTETFTDGFVIQTDSEAIAKANGIYDLTLTYGPQYLVVGDANTLKVLNDAFLRMRLGEEAELIINSSLTKEGNNGSQSNIPELQPYTPRLYKIKVYANGEK